MKKTTSLNSPLGQRTQTLINFFLHRKLLKETTWSILSKGLPLPFFLGIQVVLTRMLGVTLYGEWSFLYSLLTIIVLVTHFGINGSARRSVARYNKTSHLGSVLSVSFLLRVVISFIWIAIIFLLRPIFASTLHKPELLSLMTTALPFIFFSNLTEYFKNIFQGLHRLKFNAIINFAEYGLKFLLAFIALSLSVSLFSVLHAFSFALLGGSVVGCIMLYGIFYQPSLKNTFSIDAWELLSYSVPLFLISIGFAVATEVSTLMLGIFSTPTQVALYAVGDQLVGTLPHIALALSVGTMPIFAQITKKNAGSLKKTFKILVTSTSVIFGILCLGIITTGWWLLPKVYGPGFTQSYLPLLLLLPYLLFYAHSIFYTALLDYQGKANRRVLYLLITIILNVTLNFFLVPKYGAVGAALATSISYAPYTFLNWWEVQQTWREYQT